MSSNLQSSGRGGAGNYVDKDIAQPLERQDLDTPTLKTAVVTTGRGGTGNMAKNTDPVETRARQDVEPVQRTAQPFSHVGRGGTGNVFTADANGSDASLAKKEQEISGSSSPTPDSASRPEPRDIGWAEKGKNFLFGLGRK
ncbi:hypothetical protein B0T26DRAFT_746186 [Lasiosphaeria miniovina]|uniref:Uncharacterized protein n=1 Tax=Lasiosphaeria miniovina TaxID=1954250 RepID=A0AA40BHC5_9PEZI|nr:uncharacterized protein B0T26DRAFT_746186 [Lasiosphaeria miniovina]KAK0734250.1 hypothetical protein B0T26DRAFT_746186 [Lasiosphaeria miniovina]